MADSVERFCAMWFKNENGGRLLILAGLSGTGKTHCASRIYHWARCVAFGAMEAGNWGINVPSAMFIRWPEITDAFKSGEYGVLNDCNDADLVVIDDVGAEHDPSKNAADKLCQLLSRRIKKFTVITTNIAPSLWVTKFDARIADRFMRNSDIVNLCEVKSFSV